MRPGGGRAHPRPCGEHEYLKGSDDTSEGSSPPVRGALFASRSKTRQWGLIPARAGSTIRFLAPNPEDRAHPRPCGEHAKENIAQTMNSAHPRPCGEHATDRGIGVAVMGSSPPVRGARVRGARFLGFGWLIPARAGSTLRSQVGGWVFGAHPRPCGEHSQRWGCKHPE